MVVLVRVVESSGSGRRGNTVVLPTRKLVSILCFLRLAVGGSPVHERILRTSPSEKFRGFVWCI